MNNQIPFFRPLDGFQNYDQNQNNDRLLNKLDRLEKSIRILENRVSKLENRDNKNIIQNEPTDMYMI